MIQLHNKHPKGYKPLWKQWMKTDDYKSYIKNELPKVLELASMMDGLTTKEREDLMAKEFQLRWVDASTGKVQESRHSSEKSAKDKARELSHDNSPVQLGEVDGGKLLQQWNFDKGRQQAMNAAKQVSVAPITKKDAAKLETNEMKGMDMAKGQKPAKKGQKKEAERSKEATKVAGKVKSQPSATATKAEPKKTGTVRDQFGLREGSNRAKLVDALLEAKGKPVPISGLLKAVYGSAKEEGKSALNMVLKGMVDMIAKNKIKMEIVRAKEDGGSIALKATK